MARPVAKVSRHAACKKHEKVRAQIEGLLTRLVEAAGEEDKVGQAWGVVKESELLMGCRQCKRWVEPRKLTATLIIQAGRPS